MITSFQTGNMATTARLNRRNSLVKKEYGKGGQYDCMIGLSGGLDSSYLAYAAVRLWGLRPKFIHVDTH